MKLLAELLYAQPQNLSCHLSCQNDKINDKIKKHQNNMVPDSPDTILILKTPKTSCGRDNTNRRSQIKLNRHNKYV